MSLEGCEETPQPEEWGGNGPKTNTITDPFSFSVVSLPHRVYTVPATRN